MSYTQSFGSSAQYFLTVGEVMGEKEKMIDRQIRISGAVIGDSIVFDESSGKLSFLIAEVPADYETVEQQGGLAVVLENAVNDPSSQRIQIAYVGEKPELLRNMAQAIMTGELRSDGIFYADEILLKCPSRYEEAVPDQAIK
jgi:cytochrome c-type biogenesis protein CcmE